MTVQYLEFGDVRIEWDIAFHNPIAINHLKLNGEKPLITVCDITFIYRGIIPVTIPKGFGFDGASIPWIFQWMPGYSKIGWHLFADLIHDYACEEPDAVPRPIGDGIYLSLLLAMADADIGDYDGPIEDKQKLQKRRRRQAWVMHKAVSFWTWVQYLRGYEILGHKRIVEAAKNEPVKPTEPD